jgi:hypothetical protein
VKKAVRELKDNDWLLIKLDHGAKTFRAELSSEGRKLMGGRRVRRCGGRALPRPRRLHCAALHQTIAASVRVAWWRTAALRDPPARWRRPAQASRRWAPAALRLRLQPCKPSGCTPHPPPPSQPLPP